MKTMKLLFFDIDGTLCNPGEAPGARIQAAIRQARANGHKAFLCTGRNLPSIPSFVLDVGFDGVIASSGSYIQVGDTVLFDQTMTDAQAQRILTECAALRIACSIECDDGTYCDIPAAVTLLTQLGAHSSEAKRMMVQVQDSMSARPMAQYVGQPVYKVSLFAAAFAPLKELQRRLGSDYLFVLHGEDYLGGMPVGEVKFAGTDKGTGVLAVCDHYHVTAQDAIAFGDSLNDAEMLKAAGTSVVMGDGSPDMQRLADLVCEPCAQDGVYHAMKRLGLCNS